jgi:hypothetical protein
MDRRSVLLAMTAFAMSAGASNLTPGASASASPMSGAPDTAAAQPVTITPNESARRVDVAIGGRPFTSYIWPERVKKPVLDPIRAASGTIVTRGWPLNPRPGERVDHPHHVGLWLNHESVNGVDFWNNSDAMKPADAAKMGTILHKRVVSATGGADRGELETEMEWVMPGGRPILRERTQFVFSGDATTRRIDRIATLTALDERVVFGDAKDGMLGMRVARQLEQPSDEKLVFTDIAGRATTVAKMDNAGVTGEYTSSEGKKGDAVWATRGRWVMLAGKIGDEALTVAMVDHPSNPGYPTYWHARGYGLFAANPLGQKVFSNGRETLNLTIEPRASITFRHRILVLAGTAAPRQLEHEFAAFSGTGQ